MPRSATLQISESARDEAILRGSKTYTRTVPCRKGHFEFYVASRACKQCCLNKQKESAPFYHRTKKYGVDPEKWIRMWIKQGGSCSICKKELPQDDSKVHVDHCHATGMTRGLLCRACNIGLGYFKDNSSTLVNAAVYIEHHAGRIERGP